MGFKEEFKREMRNVKSDVAKEVEKHWVLDFEGHQIEVMNGMMEEILKVDGQIIAKNVRKSIWSHIVPFSTLKGTFQSNSGKTHKVYVKIGGFVKLNVTVKVDGKQLMHEALKLHFLPWTNKEYIVPFLEEQFQQNQQLITKDLPDDEFLYDEHHPKFAPGFADQLHQEAVTPFYTKKLIKLFLEQRIRTIRHGKQLTKKLKMKRLSATSMNFWNCFMKRKRMKIV